MQKPTNKQMEAWNRGIDSVAPALRGWLGMSDTINLPKSASLEDVIAATVNHAPPWKQGLGHCVVDSGNS
jgi:hypothetical protein